eukprot:gene9478-12769_t
MNPLVRDLYKRFLFAGRDYPLGLNYIRERAKKEFMEKANITCDIEVKKCIAKGRYWAREVIAISKFHKYREMRKRYL